MTDTKNQNLPAKGVMTSQRVVLGRRKRKAFLSVLSRIGKVGEAARVVGYRSTTFLRKMYHEDEEFAADWDAAIEAAGDMLEDEAIRRATEGIEKAVWYQGEIVGTELLYSDRLLMMLLKGAKPDKFAERKRTDITVDGEVGVALMPSTAPTMEDWERAALDVHDNQRLKLAESKIIDAQYEEVKPTKVARA